MIVPSSIETERLVIRRYVSEDFEPLYSFFSDEEATRHLDMTPEEKTDEATRALLDVVIASYEAEVPIFAMAIVTKEVGEFVGSCGMAPDDLAPEEIQIFYAILPEHQGCGFALEAARGLVDHAFSTLGIEKLFASMAAENAASVKVAERLGMICEGSIEKELHGVVYEGRRYGLTKSRFFEIRDRSRPKLKRN